MAESKIVKTTCGMCGISCGLNVYVEGDRIVKVEGMPEHVINQLCVKAEGMLDWVYSPERITHPLKRVGDKWERISWEDALNVIVDKLELHRKNYGPESLSIYTGQQAGLTDIVTWTKRFADVYGTPNLTSGSAHCFFARVIGGNLTAGHGYNHPSYRGTKCIVLWGTNPDQSSEVGLLAIDFALAYGAKLIVIDSRKTPLAKRADIHAQLRPGTDGALALGMLHVIIEDELYDKRFVENYTVGFDELAEYVKQYSPEEVEHITWVPADTIRQLARLYATKKPACIVEGISLDHCTSGIQAIRAVTTLIGITGNYDIPGGNSYVEPMPRTNLRVAGMVSASPFDEQYPVFWETLGKEPPVTHLPDAILSEEPYPIKALIVQGGSPVTQFPNTNKTIAALKKLDLLVVMDLFMTETAQLAHIFLPAATFLERDAMFRMYMGLPLCTLRKKTIEPVDESWPDWKLWFELAKRLGMGEFFPWEDVKEALDVYLEPSGMTCQLLADDPRGLFWGDKDLVKRYHYRGEGFNTPSRKLEIYSEKLKGLGYDPIPTYDEPFESPISQPELANEYPFILSTGARIKYYTHSQFRNVPSLRKYYPDPLVEINTVDAMELGINDGDWVILESLRGRVKLKASLTDDVLRKVVHADHGWSGEANINYLTDNGPLDPISGYPGFRSTLCRISRAE